MHATSSSLSRPAPAAACERRPQHRPRCGELAAAPHTMIAMLQPPLTLPSGSPWDPCIGALPLAVREQSNNYVIERGLLISAGSELTDARDSHEGSVCRGARGQTATGAKMPHFTTASLSIARTLRRPLGQRTRPAAWDGPAMASQRAARSPPSFAGRDSKRLGGIACSSLQLAADWRQRRLRL